MNVEITSHINDGLIAEVVAMDHAAYRPDDQITWERANALYHKVEDSLILLKNDSQTIGYISVFFVNHDTVKHALENQRPIYKLPVSDLLDCDEINSDIYIHNIIIRPEYQRQGYRKLLFAGLKEWVNTHNKTDLIWADVVSVGGERALRALGLVPWNSKSHTWCAKYQTMLNSLQRIKTVHELLS